ncbi:MAG: hypothetical protein KC589_09400 [Nanoarchaeota archaeon]|nr:hypothetical protein [Nanoarchaeota archaeon]
MKTKNFINFNFNLEEYVNFKTIALAVGLIFSFNVKTVKGKTTYKCSILENDKNTSLLKEYGYV